VAAPTRARYRPAPEPLFLLGAVSQYGGASIARHLFDHADAATIGWFRVLGAVILLVPFTARGWRGWSRADFAWAALFGTITAAMNMTFYVAIHHLALGNGVAIEFIGPISVAVLATRTRRNAAALVLAVAGVALLSGTEIGHDRIGLLFIFIAATLWAGYIVLGSRIARRASGFAGLSFGLLAGLIVTSPIGLLDARRVVTHGWVLAGALFVGLLSSALPYGIDQTVLRRISTRRFAVLQALLPVVATVMGFVALGQRPDVADLVGVALVVAAVATQDRS
jgi:inner membrane transporter RhtA